jgi:hypothetical protein
MTGPNGAGHGDRNETKLELREITARLAPLKLGGVDLLVYFDIRCRDRDGRGRAFPSLDQLVRDLGCAKETVCRSLSRLERLGLIRKHRRPSRGSTVYEVLGAEELTDRSTTIDGSVNDDCAIGQSRLTDSSTKLSKEESSKRRTPSGGDARARGEDFSNDEVDRRQVEMLLPIDGGGDRMAPLRRFNPSDATVEWAAEHYGLNARDDRILGEFIDWYLEHDELPADIEAAYRRWIRRQPLFDQRDAERSRPGGRRPNSTPAEDEAAAAFFAEMRAVQTTGAANG